MNTHETISSTARTSSVWDDVDHDHLAAAKLQSHVREGSGSVWDDVADVTPLRHTIRATPGFAYGRRIA